MSDEEGEWTFYRIIVSRNVAKVKLGNAVVRVREKGSQILDACEPAVGQLVLDLEGSNLIHWEEDGEWEGDHESLTVWDAYETDPQRVTDWSCDVSASVIPRVTARNRLWVRRSSLICLEAQLKVIIKCS